ncbi:MAG: threonine/serine exporter family protein [Clostridia bacterium]|nr:threonine/serine exporter family protein [Clostridia bacterium]
MDRNQRKALIPLFLNFGEAMMASGAEISRVEDSLVRIGSSYGAIRTEVFAITASLVLTLRFEDEEFTGTRRITSTGENDFNKLDKLNDLSRDCVEKHLSPEELQERLSRIQALSPKPLKTYLGSAVAAGAFALFFGGGIWDGLLSACFGLLVCLLQRKIAHRFPNKAFFLFAASLLTGCGVCLLAKILPFLPLHIDKIIIGDIMLTVPGITTTMAVRDMLIGDTISGVTKLLECLLWAGCLAAGFILALMLLGR